MSTEKSSQAVNEKFRQMMESTAAVIKEANEYLKSQGVTFQPSKWVSPEVYAQEHNLPDVQLVHDWISEGVIPPNCVISVPEVKRIIIKNIVYKES